MRASNTSARARWASASSGAAAAAQLGDVPGESQVAGSGELARPGRQLVRPAGEGGDLRGHGGLRRRLEVGGVPVVPAAVVAARRCGPRTRARRRSAAGTASRAGDCGARTVWMISSSARPAFIIRSVSSCSVSRSSAVFLERLADPIEHRGSGGRVRGAASRRRAGHRPQRDRPVLGVPLHLLGVPQLGDAQMNRSPVHRIRALGHPYPCVVVRLAACVPQLEADTADVERGRRDRSRPGTGSRSAIRDRSIPNCRRLMSVL